MVIHLRRYILVYILIPLSLTFVGASFTRFFIQHDYFISYEGTCNPEQSNCFVGCKEDGCTEEYYFVKIQKYAPDLLSQCGKDITGCKNANICLPSENTKCSISYCKSNNVDSKCDSVNNNTQ